ncbi:MAG: hypothetical protein BGO07_02890 [Alphaproteobacteria bacterium 40-19]|mgnify:CR=1 FL=1|nr:MAG: hypothetical protein BGO07_02890 [Alphaproteobacteria bacterium 40-19]
MKKPILYILLSTILPYTALGGKKNPSDSDNEKNEKREENEKNEKREEQKKKPINKDTLNSKKNPKEDLKKTLLEKTKAFNQGTVFYEKDRINLIVMYQNYKEHVDGFISKISNVSLKIHDLLECFVNQPFDHQAVFEIYRIASHHTIKTMQSIKENEDILRTKLTRLTSTKQSCTDYIEAFKFLEKIDTQNDACIQKVSEKFKEFNAKASHKNELTEELKNLDFSDQKVLQTSIDIEHLLENLTLENKEKPQKAPPSKTEE